MIRTLVIALGLALATGCRSASDDLAQSPGSSGSASGAAYELTLTPMWTAASHPLDYPKVGLLSGPHFSGLIGATHGSDFALFGAGRAPTPGLERLSEEGKHSPLDAELRAMTAAGRAGMLFESDAIKDLGRSATARVQVDDRFPMVSVVAMIAPSPDWFAGVANVDLKEGGQWVAEKMLEVFAWDSGGDDGTTYEAADADTNPKKPTMMNDAPHFLRSGARVPVARLTLKRM